MSWSSKAWLVAVSIGAVEALKDQGFARWNYAFRVVQQHTRSNMRSYTTQADKLSSAAVAASKMKQENLKQSEESLRKVMYLSCWAPN